MSDDLKHGESAPSAKSSETPLFDDPASDRVEETAPEEAPESRLFRLVIFASAAFVVTILIMSVASFSDSPSPIPTFFNEHGLTVVAVEVGIILCVGLAAMIVDRRQTLAWHARLHRQQAERSLTETNPPKSP